MNRKTIIVCPRCGMEYMPAEIYYPDEFLGHPTNIIKLGNKILTADTPDMNLEEEYVCNECNTKFKVEAEVTFKTKEVKDFFTEDF